MNHIKQKAVYGDCGVAAIAMVTNVNYERVIQSVPPDVIPFGLWHAEVLHALKKITNKTWSLKEFVTTYPLVKDYEFPMQNCIYGVTIPEMGNTFHYIACDGKIFYDPSMNLPLLLADVKKYTNIKNWPILAEFKL